MHRVRHEYSVSVMVSLDSEELRILRDYALAHYDATCRAEASEEPRGKIETLRMQMRYHGLKTIEPVLTVDTLQIWTKIMEQARDREAVVLYASLRAALVDALGEQRRLNE
jgi:hypothetical protein